MEAAIDVDQRNAERVAQNRFFASGGSAGPNNNHATALRPQTNLREDAMTSKQDTLLDWLRDAHAMEEQAVTMLTAMASRIENYPDVKAKIEQHIEETRRHADTVESCIERLGGDTSTVKDLMGKFTAMGQGLSGVFVSDEIVKGAMASYTFEHMEIAAYKVLIAAADACDDPETSAVCQRILNEEIAMAKWLEDNIDAVTEKFLARDEQADLTAKH